MNIAVIGSCGRMGLGIAELFLQTLPFKKKPFHLFLIDSNPAIYQLNKTLRTSLRIFSEKNINSLRNHFSDVETLVSNEEIIQFFIQDTLDHVTLSNRPEAADESDWIFEAIVEDIDEKVNLFKKINNQNALFFTNTSAIPIHLLASKSGLKDRLIGFHFYNPPVQNSMLEIVVPPSMIDRAENLAKDLHRTYVFAGDISGFIGNGQFIRELAFAQNLVKTKQVSFEELDRLLETQLARPFGIFKLANFIGLSTVKKIAKIMEIELDEIPEIKIPLKPHKGEIQNVTDPIAHSFLNQSREISNILVKTGAAKTLNDVHTVLKVGFHYGTL